MRVDHRTLAAQREEALERKDTARAAALNRQPEIHVGPKARQAVRHQRLPVSRPREVGAVNTRAPGQPPAKRVRDYPARDRGTRLTWLERIVTGNNERLRRDLETDSRRFDRYQQKMDYWERRITFWAEGKIRGKGFRFDRWKAAQEERQRREKAEHARRRFRQLVQMMKQLEELMGMGRAQRERGLGRIREIEGWARLAQPRVRSRNGGQGTCLYLEPDGETEYGDSVSKWPLFVAYQIDVAAN